MDTLHLTNKNKILWENRSIAFSITKENKRFSLFPYINIKTKYSETGLKSNKKILNKSV